MAKQHIYTTQELCIKLQVRPSELQAAWLDGQFVVKNYERIGINHWVEKTDDNEE